MTTSTNVPARALRPDATRDDRPPSGGAWRHLPVALGAAVLLPLGGCGADQSSGPDGLPRPLSVTVPTDERIRPGTGFYSPDSALRAQCATGTIETVRYPHADVLYESDVSVDDLLRSVSGSASFSVKAGKFRASAATEFAKSSASSKKTISLVMVARYELARDILDPTNGQLKPAAASLDPQSFAELCGDEVVTEAVMGGMIAVSVVIRAETEADASRIRAAVAARAWKVKAMSEIFSSLQHSQGKYSVQIRGMQMGGDANQLGRIIGGASAAEAMAVRDCSGGDVVDACQQVLGRAIEYAASPQRADEMARTPITLSVNTTPWRFFAPIAELNTSPGVIVARGRLNLLASENLDCIKDSPELSRHCATMNMAVLQAAGTLCFGKAAADPAGEWNCIMASQPPWLGEQGFQLPKRPSCPGGSEAMNIALNAAGSGFPSPSESDAGWGGGAQPWDILDGARSYADWARGLAFTGGTGTWAGQACGWRQATVTFAGPRTFDRLVAWHHGGEHVPTTTRVDYWNGSAWVDVGAARAHRPDLIDSAAGYGSEPTIHTFPPVTGSKVRFSLQNCDITHGWLYELQVFGACP